MFTVKQITEITGITAKKVNHAIAWLEIAACGEKDGKPCYRSADIDTIRDYYRPARR